ncbi:MAG: tyrosine-type recombinase/integrase [Pirellulales bacterium]
MIDAPSSPSPAPAQAEPDFEPIPNAVRYANTSLRRYYEDVFLPAHSARWKEPSSGYHYAEAVRQLETYFAESPPMHRITVEVIGRFESWCVDRGAAPRTAENYAKAIKAILRSFNPAAVAMAEHSRLSRASKTEYKRLLNEWLASDRYAPRDLAAGELTIAELCARYAAWAEGYYPPQSLARIKVAVQRLVECYGHKGVSAFGPLSLQAIQQQLARAKKARSYCNHLLGAIKRVFKWGVSQELVPESVFVRISTVGGLKRGRSPAIERPPIGPVSDEVVEATLPCLPTVIQAMIRIQRLTGCRPGEVCLFRPCDIDRSGEVWTFTPPEHKTAYCGKSRVVHIGPKAQEVLLPWLLRAPDSYCFDPRERVDRMHGDRSERRVSPKTPSQRARKRKAKPKRSPGTHYTTHAFYEAVRKACEANGLKPWAPNRLRHSAGTEIRKRFGLEAVQATLGHAHMTTSEIYAEKNQALAVEVARRIG